MALSSKISTIYIRPTSFTSGDWKYTIKTQDFTSEIVQVNFTEAFDEAIDASLRSNFRGFRLRVTFNWGKIISNTFDGNVDATGNDLGDLLTDVRTSLVTDGDNAIQVSFDDTNYFDVIPESMSYISTYTNQIGRASGSTTFLGRTLLTSIPTTLQAPVS